MSEEDYKLQDPMPTRYSIYRKRGNPVFSCLHVSVDDEAAGSFLNIEACDEDREEHKLTLDWDEWDELVKLVASVREQWEWE